MISVAILAATVAVGLIGFYLRYCQETRVYVDVSGSMQGFDAKVRAEIKKLFLLNAMILPFNHKVGRPVRFARDYTPQYGGGSELSAVLADLAFTIPKRVIIITDGEFHIDVKSLPVNVRMIKIGA